jgi:taurine transport system substrate-binding protein
LSGITAIADGHSITVGFLEWPMPFQFAKVNAEEALGMEVNWSASDTGTAMSAAMVSGDVQLSVIAVFHCSSATSAGQDQMLDRR